MHIIFITPELSPYIRKSPLAEDLVHFARSLKQAGHQVSAVIPSVEGINLASHPLARRLSGVSVSVGETILTAARYDGRTADGIDVFLLDVPRLESEKLPTRDADVSAAAALVASFAEVPDVCISFGVGLLNFSTEARKHPALSTVVLVANLGDAKESEIVSAPDADRVIVPRSGFRFDDEETKERAAVIPDAVDEAEVQDKPSRKVAFQMKFMLPVRREVPLVLFCDFTIDALAAFLSSDVQAVVFDERQECQLLKERYPDRFQSISKKDLSFALEAADACVVCDNKHLVSDCLTRGTIPIVTRALKDEVVDLEQDLTSGTGIVVPTRDAAHLTVGLSRLNAAFHMKTEFSKLTARLPAHAMTWRRVAAYTLGLIEEVTTENT